MRVKFSNDVFRNGLRVFEAGKVYGPPEHSDEELERQVRRGNAVEVHGAEAKAAAQGTVKASRGGRR